MIYFQHEPAVLVSGYELIAVVRVSITKYAQSGKRLFAGDKRPVAVICHRPDGEYIFNMNGCQIDLVELKTLLAGCDA